MAESAFEKLVARARSERVVVVGGGVAGLVAALECAKVGLRVTLVEASEHLGGAVADAEIGGVRVARGATGWSTAGGAVDALVEELGLSDAVIEPAASDVWVHGPAGVHPSPDDAVAGIPGNAWDPRVRRIIGWAGTWRAYLDRLRPPLTIGQQRNLGRLVGSRMGTAVRDRLVAPLTRGRYGVEPENVDVERIAPGLSSALTRTGSLAGAASELAATRAAGADAPPIRGLRGGLATLVSALESTLADYDVQVRRSAPVVGLGQDDDSWWVDIATTAPRLVDREATEADVASSADSGARERLGADAVILATGAATAARLAPLAAPTELVQELAQDVITLVVAADTVSSARTTVFGGDPEAGPVVASDESSRWGGSGDADVRVLRLTYGALETAGPLAGLGDEDAVGHALRDAQRLLGIPTSATVLGSLRERWVQPPPALMLGREDAVEDLRTRVCGIRGLGIVGAWVSGPGLARVVVGAREEAERVRVNLLWDPHADGVTLEADHPLDKREETP